MKKVLLFLALAAATSLSALSNEQINGLNNSYLGTTAIDYQNDLVQDLETRYVTSKKHKKHEHVDFPNSELQNDEVAKNNEWKEHKNRKNDTIFPLVFGSFYSFTIDPLGTIEPGEIIPLLNVEEAKNVKSINGKIFIFDKGDYLINFGAGFVPLGVSNENQPMVEPGTARIALALNGVFPQPGSNFTINAEVGLVNLSTILHITHVPAIISLVNNSDIAIGVGSGGSQSNSVAAFLTIEKLHNLPTP